MSEPTKLYLGLVVDPCPACGGADHMCADCAQERIRQLEAWQDENAWLREALEGMRRTLRLQTLIGGEHE